MPRVSRWAQYRSEVEDAIRQGASREDVGSMFNFIPGATLTGWFRTIRRDLDAEVPKLPSASLPVDSAEFVEAVVDTAPFSRDAHIDRLKEFHQRTLRLGMTQMELSERGLELLNAWLSEFESDPDRVSKLGTRDAKDLSRLMLDLHSSGAEAIAMGLGVRQILDHLQHEV